MSDGRTPEGPLLSLLRARLQLATDLDLIDVVLNRWRADRGRIAELAALVDRAAIDGDVGSARLLEQAGVELAELVITTRRRLDWPDGEPVPISHSGGAFGSVRLRDSFVSALAADGADYALHKPLRSPHVGAALYAARLDATRLDAAKLHADNGADPHL